MANVILISLVEYVFLYGQRSLSAHLRAQGHQTTILYMPWGLTEPSLHSGNSFRYPFPPRVLDQVRTLSKDANVIGISLMSNHFDQAVHLTRFLRTKSNCRIVWGGIHPTIRPSECLEYADAVCVGEGESCSGQITGESTGQFIGQPIHDLDVLPMPDLDLHHQFVLYKGDIVPLDGPLLAQCLSSTYQAMFSRGCPQSCSYCCNNAFRKIYGAMPVRWRSIENQIMELEAVVRTIPGLREIYLADESFLTRPLGVVRDFADQYKAKIGLPFILQTIARSVTEEKLSLLVDAGLYDVSVGVQSGSRRISKDLYARPETPEDVVRASSCIRKTARKSGKMILGNYDFILDNPWETSEDTVASIRLCTKFSKPFSLKLFSLTFYPGTDLYDKAYSEGLIADNLSQVYRRYYGDVKPSYLNGMFEVVAANTPTWIVTFLLWNPIRKVCPPWFPRRIAKVFELLKLAKGFFSFLIRGDRDILRILWGRGWTRILGSSPPSYKGPQFFGAPGYYAHESDPQHSVNQTRPE